VQPFATVYGLVLVPSVVGAIVPAAVVGWHFSSIAFAAAGLRLEDCVLELEQASVRPRLG